MQDDCRLTVITPCHNPGPFLIPCLESVRLNLDVVALHVVFDGGSTDGSVDILRDYARTHPHLFWVSRKDEGQSDALNKALEEVHTRYFGWINADDVYLPGGLAPLAERAAGEPRPPAIVYGDYIAIDAGHRVLYARRQPSFNPWDCLYGYGTVQNGAAIFNTAMTREAGGFAVNLQFAMDYDLVLRLSVRGTIVHVPHYVEAFRFHQSAKTARLQTVCQRETQLLRASYSQRGPTLIRLLEIAAKLRVAARMAREGCLATRLRWLPGHANELATARNAVADFMQRLSTGTGLDDSEMKRDEKLAPSLPD